LAQITDQRFERVAVERTSLALQVLGWSIQLWK